MQCTRSFCSTRGVADILARVRPFRSSRLLQRGEVSPAEQGEAVGVQLKVLVAEFRVAAMRARESTRTRTRTRTRTHMRMHIHSQRRGQRMRRHGELRQVQGAFKAPHSPFGASEAAVVEDLEVPEARARRAPLERIHGPGAPHADLGA